MLACVLVAWALRSVVWCAQLLGLRSFRVAAVLLAGLLAYDVFWGALSPTMTRMFRILALAGALVGSASASRLELNGITEVPHFTAQGLSATGWHMIPLAMQ